MPLMLSVNNDLFKLIVYTSRHVVVENPSASRVGAA